MIAKALSDSAEGGWLDPQAVESLLAAYGIATLPSRVATSSVQAQAAAEELGYPVAMKAIGPNLLHKSDIGGVALDLTSGQAVRHAFKDMRTTIGGQLTGVLIQPMAQPGVETIVGITSEPSFGPLVMFGLGGVLADLWADQSFRLVPLTDVDATELAGAGRAGPLLRGYRGSPELRHRGVEGPPAASRRNWRTTIPSSASWNSILSWQPPTASPSSMPKRASRRRRTERDAYSRHLR